ncbi:hypothetical protein [Azospirillum sp. SYSU D00513]|uniref:hypothetical protein n=1 Tax=Azospirillum sp. SYSU D00513 TaxID=2812561 RepID=UPI001A96440F|nr:hypothetical protein [Azospirillum sp. SYSU D00513]
MPSPAPLIAPILRLLGAVRRTLPGLGTERREPDTEHAPLLFDPTQPESLGAARQRLQTMTVGEMKALYLADGPGEPIPRFDTLTEGPPDPRLALRILIRQELRRRGLDANATLDRDPPVE